MEQRKAQIEKTMHNVHHNLTTVKVEEEKFEKVIKAADPKLLSLGNAQNELLLRETIREQKREIEELQRKLQNLDKSNR